MIACEYLRKQGYRILEKNFRCKIGEIDVIAEKDKRLRFVEIKTRSGDVFGMPEEAVHAAKQKKLIMLAEWYMKEIQKTGTSFSIDVVAIDMNSESEKPAVRLIQDAFGPADGQWAL